MPPCQFNNIYLYFHIEIADRQWVDTVNLERDAIAGGGKKWVADRVTI